MSINMAGASVAHTCARDPIRRTMCPMYPPQPLVLAIADLPEEPGWLAQQPCPVLAWGEGESDSADVVVAAERELAPLLEAISNFPLAAITLVQVLRTVESLPISLGMTVESLAYGLLQVSPQYLAWLAARDTAPRMVRGEEGPPIVLSRDQDVVRAQLNRAEYRNAVTVEMRDALVELLELVLLDDSIERAEVSGRGSCFSVGGELREFGLATDPASAHLIRASHNPGRLLAQCAGRVSFHLHGACIGSGIEIPAFAGHISSAPGTFFQLPELRFGLIPGAGGCVSISRRIGRQRTAWLALSGRRIDAARALEWGLIDEIRDSP